MKSGNFYLLASIIFGNLVSGQKCGNNVCTASSPCCREGFCDISAAYCMPMVCDRAGSFTPGSCWGYNGCTPKTVDFSNPNSLVPISQIQSNSGANSYDFVSIFDPSNARLSNGNLVLDLKYQNIGATVQSTIANQYGRYTANIKSASVATGVVSGFVIRDNNSGDELDFEFVGKSPNQVQTNYYYQGVLDYTKMVPYNLNFAISAGFNDYAFDWTPDTIVWYVNGQPIRTLNRVDTWDQASGVYKFPNSISFLGFTIWDGGSSVDQGTRDWAGSPTPWTPSTVYSMYVNSVTFQCYNNGTITPTQTPVPTNNIVTVTNTITKCLPN
ncbi:hypothetical protein BB558_002915 [Smittium angustum]|uniref:GH16 domain-containing protein n=1 Tax=Smittium angustum TaxID=133377 RepID=A0A2U1J7H2_SMIAN|nr:hypothetical protein BB558_006973 [Smittium angustum]PVZ99820.1 hypothetical protein BB558_004153 [Smittium angustum]PWA01014.1 hypothetical protein BB558_002915 [Smittium angustum]